MIDGMRVEVVSLVALALCVGGCARPSAVQRPSQSALIQNFQHVAPGIYRGAQPNEVGMKALKDMGVKTILSLRVPPRVNTWEAAKADALDMDFINLPLSNYDNPSEDDVKTFLKIVTDPRRQPVFVHCRQGQLRTGALMASYRVLEEGWSAERAYAEAKALGFDDQYPWYLPLKWFIQDLDYSQLASEPSP